MSAKLSISRYRNKRRAEGVGASVKIVAAAAVAFFLGLLLGAASAPSPSGATTVTRQETLTTTVVTTLRETMTLRETVTQTVTAAQPPPERPEGSYSLRILEVVVDRVSDATHDYYILELEASYRGKEKWTPILFFFGLTSDKGFRYSPTSSPAVRQYLPSVDLRDGESARGQLAFKLPKSERPAKLTYEDRLNRISLEVTEIPPPSKEVSWIYAVEVDVKSEHSFITAIGSILTPGLAFYSGEEIEVEIEIRYNKFPGQPDSITINSVEVEAFELVRMDPQLPVQVRDGEKIVLRLTLKVPEKGYNGNIKITVYA